MVSAPLSSTWDLLGGSSTTFYRKVELFSLVESNLSSIDLSDYVVVAAKQGGPIGQSTPCLHFHVHVKSTTDESLRMREDSAMMRDPSKPVLLASGTEAQYAHQDRFKINVYSTAGLLLQTVKVRLFNFSPPHVFSDPLQFAVGGANKDS